MSGPLYLTVLLEPDVDTDDAQEISRAIEIFQGVQEVMTGIPAMDDDQGERHPELGVRIAGRLFGPEYYDLVLLHSRHLARTLGREPSALCWPDKISILFEPWWLYLPRAWASGELAEYRAVAARTGYIPLSSPHRTWHRWVREGMVRVGRTQRADAMTYMKK